MPSTKGTVLQQIITTPKGFDIKFNWVSDSSGNAYFNFEAPLTGVLWKLETRPSATVAPTDNYDITVLSPHNTDILFGNGADRDTSTSETVYIYDRRDAVIAIDVHTRLRFRVANAGNAKEGVAILSFVQESSLQMENK